MTLRALLFVIKTELHVELTSVPATLIQKGEIENIFAFHLFSHQHTHSRPNSVRLYRTDPLVFTGKLQNGLTSLSVIEHVFSHFTRSWSA